MISKKGLTQADWAMSMAIFILYLAWFFIVMMPTFQPETKETMPFDELKEQFEKEASWDINQTPIIIRSNITGENEPIIVSFPYLGNTLQYSVLDKYSIIDEGRLFFLANLQRTGTENRHLYYLLHSTSNYPQPELYSDLRSSDQSASTDRLVVNFDDSIVDQAFYRDAVRILYYSIQVDGSPMSTISTSHSSNKLFSKHKIITPQINHSTYIILNNSRIYNYFNSKTQKHVTVGTRLHNYRNFYISSTKGGSLKYNQSDCDAYTTDYIDLYDDAYGLAFVFDEDVSIEMCHNKNLSITADFDVDSEFGYDIIFHSTETDTTKMTQPYKLIFGAEELLTGLSSEKLFYIENKNYTEIKSRWGYGYEFNITVMNASNNVIFSFGKVLPNYVTTAGENYNYRKLHQNGSIEKVSVQMLSW